MHHFTCDRCSRYENKETPNSEHAGDITVLTKEPFEDLARPTSELCSRCLNSFALWWQAEPITARGIQFRGSVTDLATDVAYELTPTEATELILELQRFMAVEQSKFKSA